MTELCRVWNGLWRLVLARGAAGMHRGGFAMDRADLYWLGPTLHWSYAIRYGTVDIPYWIVAASQWRVLFVTEQWIGCTASCRVRRDLSGGEHIGRNRGKFRQARW